MTDTERARGEVADHDGDPTDPIDPTDPGAADQPELIDPWKGFRGVCAATLVLEAIVVLLALPVVATLGTGLSVVSVGFLVTVAVLMLLGSGLQRRPWALTYNIALQIILLLGGFFHPAVIGVAVAFGAAWFYILLLRRNLRKRIADGRAPGLRDA
ncbi:DUF4233 domain-containing protein [Millisia brevis]|uniref:DUF4233 domain-containing protein n=1 Tax=Millisia brevis TaxID=264148 RepID=UPI0009FE699E|nr:DUF4233 domain-containing protein [Millisia brevis]